MLNTPHQQAVPTGVPPQDLAQDAGSVASTLHESSHKPFALQGGNAQPHAEVVIGGDAGAPPGHKAGALSRHRVKRKVATVSPTADGEAISVLALSAFNRLRVMRTVDLTAVCFPEREFKTSLKAAQDAMKRLKKRKHVKPYLTDRRQHIYGLTKKGADWLADYGIQACSSVRRVSDMKNPVHRLWSNFIAVCCAARGLTAHNESEVLKKLAKQQVEGEGRGPELSAGLLAVEFVSGQKRVLRQLRPDVLAEEQDGATWFEVDWSTRCDERARSQSELFASVGARLANGQPLRRVVVFAGDQSILKQAATRARRLVRPVSELEYDASGSPAFRETAPGCFEVWKSVRVQLKDGRILNQSKLVGHVLLQLLPVWLPRVRLDARNKYSTDGWLAENYLPYARPQGMAPWPALTSPLRVIRKSR